jgi:hypothetical protein
MRWVVSATLRPFSPGGKTPVPIILEAGWDQGPFWTCAENIVPHRNLISVSSSQQRVAIPIALSRPTIDIDDRVLLILIYLEVQSVKFWIESNWQSHFI